MARTIKTRVPEKVAVRWYVRAEKPEDHADVGRSLSRLPDTVNEEDMHPDMKTSDGKWTTWEARGMDFSSVKAIVIGLLGVDKPVRLYKQVEDHEPMLKEDDEIAEARRLMEQRVKKASPKPKKKHAA